LEVRIKILQAKLIAIDRKASGSEAEDGSFIESWTKDVTRTLSHRCEAIPGLLDDLETWVRIETGLDWIEQDPRRATEGFVDQMLVS